MFTTFLGFNKPGRWAASDGLLRWLSLALIVPAFSLGGLTAACAALLAANTILLTLGAWWSRSWLTRIDFRPDLRSLIPYLRIGLAFYATHVLFNIVHASGEPMVRIFSGDYIEVGYFALAHTMYLAGTTALSQLTMLFVPALSARRAGGDEAGVTRWLARLRTWLVAGGVVVVVASLLLGNALVALVLGPVYAPVAANLPPLAVALLILAFTSTTNTLALVHDRPRPVVIAASLRLLAFWSVGPLLVTGHGAWGACLAVVFAAATHSACLGWSMRRALGGELGAPGKAVALGALFVPLVWLRASGVADLLLFLTFVAVYGALLLRCGVLKTAELRTLVDTVRVSVANGRGSPAPAVL
jgi:O-antigen/teichoic acid export membrane protein